MEDHVEIKLRIPARLIAEVDIRREQATRTQGHPISRNQWFVNMTEWVVDQLPHQAVRSDLIKAWPGLPEEGLGMRS